MRPSGLKPPSRLPAALSSGGRTLQETSQSDLNARNGREGNMASMKHKPSGLPEPPTKRKTLAERAGETTNSRLQSTKTGLAGSRANGYRNTSNASTSSSTSSIRPGARGTGLRPTARQQAAAVEAPTETEEEAEAGVMGTRKGTPTISLAPVNNGKITLRKTRTHGDLRQNYQSVESRLQHSGSYTTDCVSRENSSEYDLSSRGSSLTLIDQSATLQQPSRDSSLNTAFAELSLTPKHPRKTSGTRHQPSLEGIKEVVSPSKIPKFSCTPNLRHAKSSQALQTPSPLKQKPSRNGLSTPVTSVRRKRAPAPVFLTKETLTSVPAWDTKGRLEDMESLYAMLRTQFASAADSKTALEESLSLYKSRVQELTQLNSDLSTSSKSISADLERARNDLHTTTNDLRQAKRDHEREIQDLERRHERETYDITSKHEKQLQKLERDGEYAVEGLEKEIKQAKEEMEKQKRDEIADLTSQHWEELDEVKQRHATEIERLNSELKELRNADEGRAAESADQVQSLKDNITSLQTQLEAGNATMNSLRKQLTSVESQSAALEQEKQTLISKAHFLEGNQEAQSLEFTSMSEKLADAVAAKEATIETLRREEMLRRKLNATILELKGNIRVFVRTRPLLGDEKDPARVEYPDLDSLEGTKEMVVHAPTTVSVTGKERNEKHAYAFDRVFSAGTSNREVFQECQDLVQSVIDGYNVSILSYGQTGSGKTYGMSDAEGVIPSSISHLLSEIRRLKEKGWDYVVEASFVEVYNEMINDLLGDAKTWDADDDAGAARNKKKEKHEIHHDPITGKTTVNNLTARAIWPPPSDDASWPPAADVPADEQPTDQASAYTTKAVNQLLDAAAKNRRVAATKANERSSRSHSIFMLTLKGSCPATGESSEGVLNLVDLAGSERLKQSGAEGNRMKETQAINKSLSSLGDVIAALGSGKGEAHVPYRNSKLTYLLKSSLGGTAANGKSSRTLMMLHLSPLAAHWQESRSSLLFGSKVHGTHIGAAKK
ncbi:hypothetical protein Q7P37_007795 [Cladosporium fusiforme]